MQTAYNIINNLPEKKGVIVFDIDDTLVCGLIGTPISPVIDFYNYIKKLGFTPVIITARLYNKPTIDYTFKQLTDVSVNGYRAIYFRPLNEENVPEFKKMARKTVQDTLGEIVMSVGDMPWDYGEYGGHGIKVG
jgi:predicted secreted acid phosphatase